MGKRSDFPRRPMDAYATPMKAVLPLLPFLRRDNILTFDEPCSGDGDLVDALRCHGLDCLYSGDIKHGFDALQVPKFRADAVITNPPWTRQLMHPLIWHFMRTAWQVWLLFDADWIHTQQATPLLRHCTDVVSAGRQKWIADSAHSAKDNCAWHRFFLDHTSGPKFHSRYEEVPSGNRNRPFTVQLRVRDLEDARRFHPRRDVA